MQGARRFAQGSIVALSGLVAACSSSSDTDSSSSSSGSASSSGGDTSSSSGGKTSSSSGSTTSSSGANSSCNPIGTFAFTKPVYTSGGGKLCDQLAKQVNDSGVDLTYAYTKETDGTYSQSDPTDAKVEVVSMNLDSATCVLKGDHAPITGSGKDDDGVKVNFVLKETEIVTFDGDKPSIKGTATLTGDPPGTGKGLPCTITYTTSGTKK